MKIPPAIKGRGAISNPANRYHDFHHEQIDDGWNTAEEKTVLPIKIRSEITKQIISHNQSPDVPFEQSINPFRGCEHGCIYCFAKPSHAYLDLSPGLDFETNLTIKTNAAEQLKKELQSKSYQCKAITLGANTDPYQPIERHHRITRQILEVLNEFNHPCNITTKSALVERDIDILSEMANKKLINVTVSVTTLQAELSRKLEPRASSPMRRLQTITRLRQSGIDVAVLLAPVIPVLTDSEMESILHAVSKAGAQSASYILLRLPREVAPLFKEWLHCHYPDMATHIMNRIHDMRSGQDNDSQFGQRLKGQGIFSELLAKRFHLASKKHQLNQKLAAVTSSLFDPQPQQLKLF